MSTLHMPLWLRGLHVLQHVCSAVPAVAWLLAALLVLHALAADCLSLPFDLRSYHETLLGPDACGLAFRSPLVTNPALATHASLCTSTMFAALLLVPVQIVGSLLLASVTLWRDGSARSIGRWSLLATLSYALWIISILVDPWGTYSWIQRITG